jgi:hypothetical protein
MKSIYVVTTIYVPKEAWDMDMWSEDLSYDLVPETKTRCVAWYPEESDAIACIMGGGTFLSEDGYYNLAVIEHIKPGIYPYPREDGEQWFSYDSETKEWAPTDKPKFYERVQGFGIG